MGKPPWRYEDSTGQGLFVSQCIRCDSVYMLPGAALIIPYVSHHLTLRHPVFRSLSPWRFLLFLILSVSISFGLIPLHFLSPHNISTCPLYRHGFRTLQTMRHGISTISYLFLSMLRSQHPSNRTINPLRRVLQHHPRQPLSQQPIHPRHWRPRLHRLPHLARTPQGGL